jgi:hypothetical protein
LLKRWTSPTKKIPEKYGFVDNKRRNNFPYRNFSRFEMKFELKFREASMSWKQGKLTGKTWKLGILWNLANKLLVVPSFKENKFQAKCGARIWISLEGGIWIAFAVVWNLD